MALKRLVQKAPIVRKQLVGGFCGRAHISNMEAHF